MDCPSWHQLPPNSLEAFRLKVFEIYMLKSTCFSVRNLFWAGALLLSTTVLKGQSTDEMDGNLSQVNMQGDNLSLQASWSKSWSGKVWIGILQDQALYQAEVEPAKSASSQNFSVALQDNVPHGKLQVMVVPIGMPSKQNLTADFKWWDGEAHAATRPFSWGVYRDNQGLGHPWNTTMGGMMMRDGEPFMPVGGMMNTVLSWGTHPTDPTVPSSDILEAQFDLLTKYGVRDIYFNGFSPRSNPKSLARAVEVAEAHQMHYGISVSGWPPVEQRGTGWVNEPVRFSEMPVKNGDAGAAISIGLTEDECGDAPRIIWAVFSNATGKLLASGVDAGTVADKDMGKFKKIKLTKELSLQVHFTSPLLEDGKLVYLPEMRMPKDQIISFGDHMDDYTAYLKSIYGGLNFGPGLRLWIDPFINELHALNDSIPDSKGFLDAYAAQLTGFYHDIGALNKAWGNSGAPLADFNVASRLVPVRKTADGAVWIDPSSNTAYVFNSPEDESLRDFTAFRNKLGEDYVGRVADALKEIADVPVVLKHNTWISPWHINSRKSGGQDGVGFESYCLGDSLAYHNSLVAEDEALASEKHQWTLETETSAAAFEGQKDYPGYRDRLQMLDSFDLLVMCGAKGVYSFGLSFDQGGPNFQTTTLLRDPRQLEWLATYGKTLAAASNGLQNYIPEVYGWYPASLHEKQLVGEQLKPFEMDANYLGTTGQIRMAPDGRWILPALRPDMPFFGLLTDWDLLASPQKQALADAKPAFPVWLLSSKTDAGRPNSSYKTYPLDSFTQSGIGVIPPDHHGMTLNEFRQKIMGYQVFQTSDADGQTLPDGSLMVWTCTDKSQADLHLPAGVTATNLQGENVPISPLQNKEGELVLQPDPHPRKTGNVPHYVGYLKSGYYYDETPQKEVVILKGTTVDQLLSLNEPAWHRWLPQAVPPADVAAWQEAETPVETTFNQPRLEGFSTCSDGAVIGINTHMAAPDGKKFSARYEMQASQPFSTVWVREMDKSSMDLEILVDGNSVGKVPAHPDIIDGLPHNPWDAGLGMAKLSIGWAKVSLSSSLPQGKHTVELVATPSEVQNQKIDTDLLGGQGDIAVENEAAGQFAKLRAIQLDALMLSK